MYVDVLVSDPSLAVVHELVTHCCLVYFIFNGTVLLLCDDDLYVLFCFSCIVLSRSMLRFSVLCSVN